MIALGRLPNLRQSIRLPNYLVFSNSPQRKGFRRVCLGKWFAESSVSDAAFGWLPTAHSPCSKLAVAGTGSTNSQGL